MSYDVSEIDDKSEEIDIIREYDGDNMSKTVDIIIDHPMFTTNLSPDAFVGIVWKM